VNWTAAYDDSGGGARAGGARDDVEAPPENIPVGKTSSDAVSGAGSWP
jgi:hypothetical protein